jgi:hypothetical protein
MKELTIKITEAANGHLITHRDEMSGLAFHRDFVYVAASKEELRLVTTKVVETFIPASNPK